MVLILYLQVHTKRRHRVAQKRLDDFVYDMYNQNLKSLYDKQEKDDHRALTEIDESNERLLGEMGAGT